MRVGCLTVPPMPARLQRLRMYHDELSRACRAGRQSPELALVEQYAALWQMKRQRRLGPAEDRQQPVEFSVGAAAIELDIGQRVAAVDEIAIELPCLAVGSDARPYERA